MTIRGSLLTFSKHLSRGVPCFCRQNGRIHSNCDFFLDGSLHTPSAPYKVMQIKSYVRNYISMKITPDLFSTISRLPEPYRIGIMGFVIWLVLVVITSSKKETHGLETKRRFQQKKKHQKSHIPSSMIPYSTASSGVMKKSRSQSASTLSLG